MQATSCQVISRMWVHWEVAGTLSEKDVSAKLRPRSCVSNGTPVFALTSHTAISRQHQLTASSHILHLHMMPGVVWSVSQQQTIGRTHRL